MSNIPEARRYLSILTGHVETIRTLLAKIDPLMTRPSPVRRAKRTSQRLTPTLARRIRVYANNHPKESYRSIAAHFNVDDGRVSEAVRNLR